MPGYGWALRSAQKGPLPQKKKKSLDLTTQNLDWAVFSWSIT